MGGGRDLMVRGLLQGQERGWEGRDLMVRGLLQGEERGRGWGGDLMVRGLLQGQERGRGGPDGEGSASGTGEGGEGGT